MEKKESLSSGEAQQMLLRLEEFYKEPVLPLHHFCRAMEVWFECIEKNNTDPALRRHQREHGYNYFQFLNQMSMDITKSNLLGRLLYAKEPLRTRMCPIHQGHYNGEAMFFTACPHACDGTGWLREREGDGGYTGIIVRLGKIEDGELKVRSAAATREANRLKPIPLCRAEARRYCVARALRSRAALKARPLQNTAERTG